MSRMKTRKTVREQAPERPRICSVPDCGRRHFSQGFCQTHHRQMATTGTTWPIRPYRKRSPGTEKFAGLRLTAGCAELIAQRAEQEGLSNGAVIAEILEEWARSDARRPGH